MPRLSQAQERAPAQGCIWYEIPSEHVLLWIELSHAMPVTCRRPGPPRLALGRANSREVISRKNSIKCTKSKTHWAPQSCLQHTQKPPKPAATQQRTAEGLFCCLYGSQLQPPARSALPGALGKVRVSFIIIILCNCHSCSESEDLRSCLLVSHQECYQVPSATPGTSQHQLPVPAG